MMLLAMVHLTLSQLLWGHGSNAYTHIGECLRVYATCVSTCKRQIYHFRHSKQYQRKSGTAPWAWEVGVFVTR